MSACHCVRFRCLVLSDSLDTKNIMSASPSENDSWSRVYQGGDTWPGHVTRDHNVADPDYPCQLSPRSYTLPDKPDKEAPEERRRPVETGELSSEESSKLMENEVASPVEDISECCA